MLYRECHAYDSRMKHAFCRLSITDSSHRKNQAFCRSAVPEETPLAPRPSRLQPSASFHRLKTQQAGPKHRSLQAFCLLSAGLVRCLGSGVCCPAGAVPNLQTCRLTCSGCTNTMKGHLVASDTSGEGGHLTAVHLKRPSLSFFLLLPSCEDAEVGVDRSANRTSLRWLAPWRSADAAILSCALRVSVTYEAIRTRTSEMPVFSKYPLGSLPGSHGSSLSRGNVAHSLPRLSESLARLSLPTRDSPDPRYGHQTLLRYHADSTP